MHAASCSSNALQPGRVAECSTQRALQSHRRAPSTFIAGRLCWGRSRFRFQTKPCIRVPHLFEDPRVHQARHPQAVGPSGEEASTSDSRDGAAESSRRAAGAERLNRNMVAAMALSPIAALSLEMVRNPEWRESAKDFSDRVRQRLYQGVNSDRFRGWWGGVDEGLTFMDWTYKWTGVDFSYIWDAELWVKFKEAVVLEQPEHFWNKLWDRIEYRNLVPQAGIVGDMRMSYSKFMQLLEQNRIKRVIVYGDMKTAVVEVPHPWYASMVGAPGTYPFQPGPHGEPMGLIVPNPEAPDDPMQWFAPEMPEWNMEKYRFYVDLPGDFWEGGQLLGYLRSKYVKVQWDAASKEYIMPYEHFTKVGEVRTELQLLDASDSWDFMAWLTHERKLEFYEKCAAVCLFIRGVTIAINVVTNTQLFQLWRKKTEKKSKGESMWARLTKHTAREFMSKDKSGKMRDTGVRFADIAGLDHIVFEMREVVKMLLGDPAYVKVGAKCPKGIIFQGPPGTGKTYLARAIAGEAGVTFLSAVGSEFVEMFAGVAAARVNNLYYVARNKAPCIIFIDEIDAIGRSRSALGNDPGSLERESALLSMLVQMDGIHGALEKVLTIGATNLAPDLDQALLRPGRFEVVYEIPSPGPVARMEILAYHARNKPLDDTAMLKKVAEATQGWSAASLANLMNEAAILTVRRNVSKITLAMVLEIIENMEYGIRFPKLPPSAAKDRLALITAAKAVAFALTPGIDEIKSLTMWSKKRGLGPYVDFIKSEDQLREDWHPEEIELMDYKTNFKVNAAVVGNDKLGEFLHVASLLQPMYAGRAAELLFFGKEGVSLATAAPLADCFELGYYCVRNSTLHPKFRRMSPLHTYIWLGQDSKWRNQRDPLAVGLDEELGYHKLTLRLLKAAWRRTQLMIKQRQSTIVRVAEELSAAPDETLSGTRLVEIVESTPLDDASDIVIEQDFLPILKETLGKVPHVVLEGTAAVDNEADSRSSGVASVSFRGTGGGASGQATFSRGGPSATPQLRLDDATLTTVSRAIMGRLDVVDLIGKNTALEVAERVREALLHPETVERLTAIRKYVESEDAPFPPRPLAEDVPLPLYGAVHMNLEYWKQRRFDTITMSALDMLFTEKQRKFYHEDADVSRFEDTSQGRKKAAEAAAAAEAKGSAAST